MNVTRAVASLTLAALVGCSSGSGSGTPPLLDSLSMGQLLDQSDRPNVLKGMMVEVDDSGRAYVAGIMTHTLGVVDLATGQVRSFPVADEVLNNAKLIYDNLHDRLWIVSTRGNYILLVDPDAETVVAEADISADLAPGADTFPVTDAALDPVRQVLYIALNDGSARIAVYDSTLQKTGDILDGQNPYALRWDAARDALIVLTAPLSGPGAIMTLPAGNAAQATSITAPAKFNQPPPNHLAIEAGGDVYVAGSSLWKVNAITGQVIWETALTLAVSRIDVSGSEIGVLHRYGPSGQPEEYLSRFVTYSDSTGAELAEREAGYEASRMTALPQGGFLVGAGGDGDILVFPQGAGAAAAIDIGRSVEDFHFSPDGSRCYLLNRLGGSSLVEYSFATGQTQVLERDAVGAWPIRMAIRAASEEIFVLSHFESKLSVIDIDSFAKTGEIDLGVQGSISDTISDLASDPDGELLACVLSEQGTIVVVDGASHQVLGTAALGNVLEGYGPGRMHAAVDAVHQRVFVYLADGRRLYQLTAANQWQVATSVQILPDSEASMNYAAQGLYYSPSLNKLFAWGAVYDADTLTQETSLASAQRLVGEKDDFLYAQRQDSDGTEYALILDAASYAVLREERVGRVRAMGSNLVYDFPRWRFAEALAAEAKVYFYLYWDPQ